MNTGRPGNGTPLPRPAHDARAHVNLNGIWDLQPGNPRLIPEEWNHKVPVPALVDCADPGYEVQEHDCHWYRRKFDVPQESMREKALVVLEQAMFGTDVWLNGHHLGGDIACYTSQVYDVPDGVIAPSGNELFVSVGSRRSLPAESAAGNDQERDTFIPGIWGDVSLIFTGSPSIVAVQVIPQVNGGAAEVRVTVRNRCATVREARVSTRVFEKRSGRLVGGEIEMQSDLEPGAETVITFHHGILDARLWSPDSPFLYEVVTGVRVDAAPVDVVRTSFGMRSFAIVDGHFHLNGQRIFLRGGNIAFHRFLSDPERSTLPWDPAWIRRVLIDIPREHNFNFFRNHLGQMYNRWYDIADEHGMLLQNEWPFWTTSGTQEQITREFSRWIRDNANHPSIVIWDALNECSDPVVQLEVVPKLKAIDSTRPWESVDFVEDHPYIYSLGPVLNAERFGFTRSLQDIEHSTQPTVINEFLWWWLDREGNPSPLTRQVVQRWLGRDATLQELQNHQCFLARELVELFRRMRVDAVQPFVYLSNNAGPTGHWFSGPIRDLQPKPVLAALKEAFAPFGVSVELWDRHFFPGEHRTMEVFVFNDEPTASRGVVRYGVRSEDGRWIMSRTVEVSVQAASQTTLPIVVGMPVADGRYRIRAELLAVEGGPTVAVSEKPAFVVSATGPPPALLKHPCMVLDDAGEVTAFLRQGGIQCTRAEEAGLTRAPFLVVVEGALREPAYLSHVDDVTAMVSSGGTLLLLEPERGISEATTTSLLRDVDLRIVRRADPDKGGYDSYVFAEDHGHPLWRGISREHLKMFNGAYGGEMVSQHEVTPGRPCRVLARCGLKLNTAAVEMFPYGNGMVIISRIQIRGRLLGEPDSAALFGRRKDPVAQRYLYNMLAWAMSTRGARE